MINEEDDFDKLMKEIDAGAEAVPAAPAPTPARRGKKAAAVTTVEDAPAVTQQVTQPDPPAPDPAPQPDPEPQFVKIAGLKPDPEPGSVRVTIVDSAPSKEPYLSPQTLAEMEMGRATLSRFK